MKNYQYLSHYAEDQHWRESLNHLTRSMWGITVLDERDKDYVPFSMAFDNQIVANICVGRFDLIVNEKPLAASMIQTVITEESHRNRGLIRQLFEPVQAHIEATSEATFFTANKNKNQFYSQFGYKSCPLISHFTITEDKPVVETKRLKKIDLNNDEQKRAFLSVAAKRAPVSNSLGFVNRNWLMFWFLKYFHGNELYLLDGTGCYIILQQTETALILKDIIAEDIPQWEQLKAYLPLEKNRTIECRFTPDQLNVEAVAVIDTEDDFYYAGFEDWPSLICLPETQRG